MACRTKKVKKRIDISEIQPDKRVWEYDGDGTKIYKLDQGYLSKTLYPNSEEEMWRKVHHANLAMERAQDPWFKEYWKRVRDYCKRRLN